MFKKLNNYSVAVYYDGDAFFDIVNTELNGKPAIEVWVYTANNGIKMYCFTANGENRVREAQDELKAHGKDYLKAYRKHFALKDEGRI